MKKRRRRTRLTKPYRKLIRVWHETVIDESGPIGRISGFSFVRWETQNAWRSGTHEPVATLHA